MESVQKLKKLPYKRIIVPEEDGGYSAEIAELSGCLAQGETLKEAVENLEISLELWIETSLEQGADIPEPYEQRNYSGQFNVRVPTSLHKTLVEHARQEHVSLNAYVNALLQQGDRQVA